MRLEGGGIYLGVQIKLLQKSEGVSGALPNGTNVQEKGRTNRKEKAQGRIVKP